MISRHQIKCTAAEKCHETFADVLESAVLTKADKGEYIPGIPRYCRHWRVITEVTGPNKGVIRMFPERPHTYDILRENFRAEGG